MGAQLYRRGVETSLLKCVTKEEADIIMFEVHEGVCASHVGGRSLVAKVLRVGFYWPTLRKDCMEYMKKCEKCQVYVDLHGHLQKFGVSATIVSDNGTQFTNKVVKDFCAEMGIEMWFASVEHPQSNGQVEAANKIILNVIKKCLGEIQDMTFRVDLSLAGDVQAKVGDI
ncbi:uncharacterized protein LOC130715576 [Lotus japonicus]|uniref:uncharacterized protein LOC130715576 n=1 Tax=Lotus japonicus TaxID=34305 RepID=UPI00258363E5|nr:uncharacterized protein LOC130715576 [Lotus japonicus]